MGRFFRQEVFSGYRRPPIEEPVCADINGTGRGGEGIVFVLLRCARVSTVQGTISSHVRGFRIICHGSPFFDNERWLSQILAVYRSPSKDSRNVANKQGIK